MTTTALTWSALRQHGRRTMTIWGWASLAALLAAALMVLQDALYGGLPSSTPFTIAVAQYTLPWLMWAALAPGLVLLFAHYPIDPGRPARGVAFYLALGVVAVGVKLLISAPLSALLIWRPLGVAAGDGLRWIFANRASGNLIIFWLLVGTYTAWRQYHATASPAGQGMRSRSVAHATSAEEPATALPPMPTAPMPTTASHSVPATASPPTPATPAQLERIPVRAGHGTAFIAAGDILFIEAERNQLVVHSVSGRHTLRSTLSAIEPRLPRAFVRIHRSFIVNVRYVVRIEPWGRGDYVAILSGGQRILSGKTFREVMRGLLEVPAR